MRGAYTRGIVVDVAVRKWGLLGNRLQRFGVFWEAWSALAHLGMDHTSLWLHSVGLASCGLTPVIY